MIALLILFGLLQTADIATTIRALDRGAREINPVVHWFMARLGMVWGACGAQAGRVGNHHRPAAVRLRQRPHGRYYRHNPDLRGLRLRRDPQLAASLNLINSDRRHCD